MEPTKTCPECGSEYAARAQSCADCHVALVWRRERPRPLRAGQGDPWAALPDGPAGLLIEDDQQAIDYYVNLLADAGIPSAVLPVLRSSFEGGLEPVPDGSGVGFRTQLFAARIDYETADLLVRDGFARRNPALAETPYLEFPAEGCPACGANLPEDAEACPDCGLEFPAGEV